MKDMYQFSLEDDQPTDEDIDELFSHLEQFTPPDDFVNRVMNVISQLPLPQHIHQPIEQGDEQSGLVVYPQQQQLSGKESASRHLSIFHPPQKKRRHASIGIFPREAWHFLPRGMSAQAEESTRSARRVCQLRRASE